MKPRKIPHLSIIPATGKNGYRNDDALTYISNYLKERNIASTEILDPSELDLKEDGHFRTNPGRHVRSVIKRIRSSVGVLIVAPEFEGEYPSHVKSLIDFLYEEWDHKPVAISTVSSDMFSRTQVIKSLRFALWKINSWTVPVSFRVPEQKIPSRNTDFDFMLSESTPAGSNPSESNFHEVFDNYCSKYLQLCTKVEYAV
jgi:NAD(P)H-dependent FMN reductase